ncbi:hypothetical protein EV191_12041 [Tamaricihabitans halophyticus]|uniref:Uncharacterized protein n=1 Tax=Tamaricihabitans halophyticus TaxID=1262583 RepID=A0A4R2Q5I6_9PSEU|nr:hypothetical protein [Tamaricihabitans halophyticus]TCP43887.1 hypothetical protein EV191_12041 [Tamaricihabitans halophyticus]
MTRVPPSSDEAPHLAALRQAVDAGFHFRPLAFRPEDGGVPAALHGERWSSTGVVETISMQAMTEAIAARIRIEDYPRGDPLWQLVGTVAEVIAELLALPAHGSPGAPTLARRASSSLWLPGNT